MELAENARKYTLEMIGDACRDIGILILVFMPLDAMFAQQRLSWGLWVLSLAVGLAFVITGIQLERKRSL